MHLVDDLKRHSLWIMVVSENGCCNLVLVHIDVAASLRLGQVQRQRFVYGCTTGLVAAYLHAVRAPKLTVSLKNGRWYQLNQQRQYLMKLRSYSEEIKREFSSSHLSMCMEIILIRLQNLLSKAITVIPLCACSQWI